MMQAQTRNNSPCNYGFFSDKLASEFQSVLQDQYGKITTLSEAQQIGLRIAQFVFLKEAGQRTSI